MRGAVPETETEIMKQGSPDVHLGFRSFLPRSIPDSTPITMATITA
jgi:hypothetical protein